MNVLVDTCTLLALACGELPDDAAAALRLAPEARVSVVSAWEVAIKAEGADSGSASLPSSGSVD